MNFKRITTVLIILLNIYLPGICQIIDLSKYRLPLNAEGITLYHLNSDSLFHEPQNVVVAEYKNEAFPKYQLAIAYLDSSLQRTSLFGEKSKALVALNGSFFDVQKGGSVVYIESEGKVIARNRRSKDKWAKTDSLLNGAIILDYSGNLKIEIAKSAAIYERSDQEKTVLVSGPILLVDGQILPLENSGFVNNSHPRSCLCKTTDRSILFIAIDGRSKVATGMSLKEVQQFLLRLTCKDAINLDGGGSTTLWINDGNTKGIMNKPSDKEGERPVANILLIKKND